MYTSEGCLFIPTCLFVKSLVVAGLGTGTVEGFMVTPFERVKVQLQAQRHRMSEVHKVIECIWVIVMYI